MAWSARQRGGSGSEPSASLAALLAVVVALLTPVALLAAMAVQADQPMVETAVLDPLSHRAVVLASTVRISVRGCEGPRSGSGFVVGDTLITNRHVVAGAFDAKFEAGSEAMFRPVVSRSDVTDLAQVDARGVNGLIHGVLADSDPAPGTLVRYAGFVGNGRSQVEEARVHLYADGADFAVDGPVMVLDGDAAPGFSGAPVIDEHGRVVGVVRGYDEQLRLTLAVPVSSLQEFAVGSVTGSGPDSMARPDPGPASCGADTTTG